MAITWESVKPAGICELSGSGNASAVRLERWQHLKILARLWDQLPQGPGGLLVASYGCVMTERTALSRPRDSGTGSLQQASAAPADQPPGLHCGRRPRPPRPSITDGDQRRTRPLVEMATERCSYGLSRGWITFQWPPSGNCGGNRVQSEAGWNADKTGRGRSRWRASSYEVTPSRSGGARGRPANR